MTSSVISLLVWAPFLLIAAICGVSFALLGYKRGTPRALISLAATLLSAVVSVILARLIASFPASFVESLVVNAIGSDYAPMLAGGHMAALVSGLATAVCALVIFIPVFLLIALLIKLVSSAVFRNLIPQPKKIGNNLGGMAISIVDALLFTLILLLPLYGTLGLGNEVYTTVASLDESLAAQQELVSSAGDTLLSKTATSGPFALVYDNLLSFSHEGETINLPETVRGVSHIAAGAAAFGSLGSGSAEVNAQVIAMLNETEKLLTDNTFFVGLVCDVANTVTPDEDSTVSQMLSGYNGLSDKDTLHGDLPALFQVLRSGVESGVVGELLSDEPNLSNADIAGFSQSFSEALNSTDSLASFKASTVNTLVDLLIEEAVSDPAQRDQLKNTLGELPTAPLTGDAVKAEGDSITMLLNGVAALANSGSESISGAAIGNMIEGLARHPSIGVDKTVEVAGVLIGANAGDGMSEAVTSTLRDALNASVSRPVEDATFGAFVDTTMNTADVLTQIQQGNVDPATMEQILTANPEVLTQLKDSLTDELLNAFGDDIGEEATTLLSLVNALFTAISENDMTADELKTESQTLSNALVLLYQLSNNSENDHTDLIDSYLASEILGNTVSLLIKDGTSDPCGFELNDETKATFADILQEKNNEFKDTNPDTPAKLRALATFLGVSVSF
ncbi:MAG: CvpA family protein [Ruminococcaceae bacterium]|nr:CvpA family protein [Oscillospiraceae bacterium]